MNLFTQISELVQALVRLIPPPPTPEERLARVEHRLVQFGDTMPAKRKEKLEARAEGLRRQINE